MKLGQNNFQTIKLLHKMNSDPFQQIHGRRQELYVSSKCQGGGFVYLFSITYSLFNLFYEGI